MRPSPSTTAIWLAVTPLLVAVLSACSPTGEQSPSPVPLTTAAAPWPSPLDLSEIRAEITQRAGDQLTAIGDGAGTVVVDLRAGAAALARQIVDAYGPAVRVTVGLLPFPPPETPERGCVAPSDVVNHPSLSATLDMQNPVVVSGDTFSATVRITNTSASAVTLETSSSLAVYLFDPRDAAPLGASEIVSIGMGLGRELEAGQSITVPGDGGTASCDLTVGYALPPGRYDARALVDFEAGPGVFWSHPLTVDVVAPQMELRLEWHFSIDTRPTIVSETRTTPRLFRHGMLA